MRKFNLSTAYEHSKQYSQSPSTLDYEVCQQVYPALSVRSHLRTKKHQKNAIEFTKQIMLIESADLTQTSKSSLRENFSKEGSKYQ